MKRNYTNGHYRFIPNGVDYEIFSRLNRNENKKKEILVLGRIHKFKNVQHVVSTFARIRGYDDWKLVIVGDLPYRDEVEKIVHEYGINGRGVFTGRLDNKSEEILEAVSHASIYVSAS